jgi:hydrogenase expression/formation protein HypD
MGVACATAGFEPVDQFAAIARVLEQIVRRSPCLENTYRRVIKPEGNARALAECDEVFELRSKRWRGMADIPASGYVLRNDHRQFSAHDRFAGVLESTEPRQREHPKGCRCADVTFGLIEPTACPMFATHCTTDHPYGPCMVSHEGTCRSWFLYGTARGRIHVEE